MANLFEKELGIPLPQCCSQGDCCKGASPSKPFHQLLKRAATGDEFARGFFSIMEPYASHEAARKVVPGLVERTLAAARKSQEFENNEDDVVFYHCRYLQADNKCGVYEDRPQFCRDYPDTPFVVFAPGCAFESWGTACREKYNEMKEEVAKLKAMKEELASLQACGKEYTNIDEKNLSSDNTSLSLVLSLTNLYLASPLYSTLNIT
jgi:Fe-S-cluster containining protein